MSKILVGYISGSYTNGINTYLINFLNSQNKNNQIDLLTTDDVDSSKKRIGNNKNNIYKISRGRHFIKQLFELRKIIKRNKYDVAYFNISESYNCLGLLIAKLFGIKKIVVHSHSSDACGNLYYFKKIINKLFKFIIGCTADEYYACSDKAAKWLFPKKIYKTDSYRIIYNQVDFDKFSFSKENRDEIRKKLKIKDEFVLGFVGRLSAEKNYLFLIDILTEVLKKKKNTKLLCIGNGEIKQFKEYAKEKEVIDSIIICPPTKEVYKYYSAIDVFLLPSRNEGLPLVGVEAQINNCPAFFSNTITEDIVIGKKTKLLPIDNAEIWANEILKVNKRDNPLNKNAKEFNTIDDSQFYSISDKNSNKLSNLYYNYFLMILLTLHYLINITNYFNGLNYILIPCFFLMILLSIGYLKNYKSIFKNIIFVILYLFVIDYFVTFFFTTNYNTSGFIKGLIWMIILFGFVYGNKNIMDKKLLKYDIEKEMIFFIIIVTLLNIFNFYLLLSSTKGFIKSFTGETILFGMSSWNRFYGIFYDPNYASIICSIAIIMSFYLILAKRNMLLKVLLLIFNFFQILYLIISQSRTALLSLFCGAIVFCIMLLCKYYKKINIKNIIAFVCYFVIIFASISFTINYANKRYNEVNQPSQISPSTNNNNTGNSKSQTENNNKINVIGRNDVNNNDISNRRIDIWKSCIEIYKDNNYIFGVGHNNVLHYAKNKLSKTYIVNNDFAEFSVAHNVFIDVLVSQGLIGVTIFVLLVVVELIMIFKAKIFKLANENYLLASTFISVLVVLSCSSMFLSEIFYINNACTFMFWLLLSYLNYYIIRSKYE